MITAKTLNSRTTRPRGFRRKDISLIYLLLLPPTLVIVLFQLVPVIWSAVLSFASGGILGSVTFVGIQNYLNIFKDRVFITTLTNTFQFAVTIIPGSVLFGLILAILLQYVVRFKKWFLGFIFFPLIPALTVSAIAWSYVIHPIGALNYIVTSLGFEQVNWLGTPSGAFWSVVMFEIWRGVGFYVVVFYGAILNIPSSLYEAARMDGYSEYEIIWRVTIPMLRASLLFCTMMATIWNFQLFDSIYILTHGGPMFETSTISWYIYTRAFMDDKLGLACAMAVVLLLIIFFVSIVQMKFLNEIDEN